MPLRQLDRPALIARRRTMFDQLRSTTGARVAQAWNGPDHYTDDRLLVKVAAPIVVAAQTRAAATQHAYLEAVLGRRLPINFDRVLEKAAVDLSDPYIAFANALSNGLAFTEAVTAGAARAEGVGESSVTYAARAASSAADRHVAGWERIPGAGACDWCETAAGQLYHSADSASFGHDRCNCDLSPA